MRFDKLIYQAYCQGDPFQFDMCIEFLFGLLLHTCFSSTERECLKYGGKKKWVCGSVLCEINVTSCARFLDFTSTTKSLQIK